MSHVRFVLCVAGGLLTAWPARLAASCRIANDTGYNFVVASGNVANQRVGPHATTTIEAGKVQGKTAEGKQISGVCKDGGDLVVKERNGVPLLQAQPKKKK
jgi:hypothetical protein